MLRANSHNFKHIIPKASEYRPIVTWHHDPETKNPSLNKVQNFHPQSIETVCGDCGASTFAEIFSCPKKEHNFIHFLTGVLTSNAKFAGARLVNAEKNVNSEEKSQSVVPRDIPKRIDNLNIAKIRYSADLNRTMSTHKKEQEKIAEEKKEKDD